MDKVIIPADYTSDTESNCITSFHFSCAITHSLSSGRFIEILLSRLATLSNPETFLLWSVYSVNQ